RSARCFTHHPAPRAISTLSLHDALPILARDREVRLDEHAPGAVELHPERPAERRRGHTGGPEHRAGADLLAAEPHGVRGHARDDGPGAHLDPDTPERALGASR